MLELILMLLCSAFIFFMIVCVCMFFAKHNANPFPDLNEFESDEERSLEEERQRRTVQGMYQMREGMKGKIY